jgi:hypothetical protein
MRRYLGFLIVFVAVLLAQPSCAAPTTVQSKIGKEDLKYWDGKNSTFTRRTSTGGSLSLTPIDAAGAVDILQAHGGGTARSLNTLKTACSSIGTTNAVGILLSPGNWEIDGDYTVTDNIRLIMADGAYFTIGAGKTLTVASPGHITAEKNQKIFAGTGTVAFTLPGVVWANWWGAKGDATDAAGTKDAIQAAITAAAPVPAAQDYDDQSDHAGVVKLACGHYLIDEPIVTPEDVMGLSIIGECGTMHGYGQVIIQWAGETMSDTDDWMIDAGGVLGFRLANIHLIGNADDDNSSSRTIQNGIFVRRTADFYASGNIWEDVTVRRFPGIGVQFGDYTATDGGTGTDTTNTDNSYIKNLMIYDCRTGMVIDSPNFLQVHFSRLVIGNYGGNPVDGDGVPEESASAAPVKFRTKNAVRILHGEFQATDAALLASYADTDAESQYAIYCDDGSFNLNGGYSETRFLAYITNGPDNDGGTAIKNVNSISHYHLYPGSAGGPDTDGKYPVHNKQSQVPLVLVGTKDINVYEDLASAGTQSIGCRSQEPVISWTAKTSTNYARNPKSNDWGSVTMTSDSGLRWDSNNMFGALGRIGSDNNGEIVISTNLVKRTTSTSHCYLFVPNDTDNNETHGVIIDDEGLQTFMTNDLTPGACYTLDFIRASSSDKVYPALQGDWKYSDADRKAGYRYLPDRRAFHLFGTVTGGTGLILYTPARIAAGTVYRIATTANRAYCGLYIDQNGGLYHEDGSTTSVSLDGIVLMTD